MQKGFVWLFSSCVVAHSENTSSIHFVLLTKMSRPKGRVELPLDKKIALIKAAGTGKSLRVLADGFGCRIGRR